jgi:trimeric autotransporter adhesin
MSMRRIFSGARLLMLCLAGAVLVACQDLFVEPVAPDAAGLAILLHTTAAARGDGADAFDRAERARIRIARGDGTVVFDQQLDLPPSGSERAVDIELEIEGDTETLQLETQLLWSGSVLFEGAATITVQRGGTTDVDVALNPVAAGIDVAPAAGPITALGGTVQLTGAVVHATGDPIAGATISWTSLDPGIATVTPQGLVTAHAEGVARITASAMGQQTMVNVTVQIAVATLDLDPSALELAVGEARQVVATPRDANGNALSRPVTWQSAAQDVATVDGNGVVRAVAQGSTTVSASAGGVSANISVAVSDVAVASVSVEPASATLAPSQTVQLQAIVRDAAGNVLTGRTVTWSSNNAAVATVNGSGLVTGAAGGQATITAATGGRTGSAQVTVDAPAIQVSTNVVAVATTAGTNPAPRTVGIGNSGTGTLSGLSTSIAYTGPAQGWLSASLSGTAAPSTLTLSFVVAGLVEGSYRATVTVASSLPGVASKEITVDLAVGLVPVARVRVEPASRTLLAGQTVQLTAATLDASDNVLTGRPITWTTSNPGVATVSASGLVTAAAGGSATITATSEGQVGTATITVDVPAIAVSTNLVSVGATVGTNPTAATVTVTNGGTGTLSGLSTSIAYGTGSTGWLTASLSGATAPSTLTLAFAAAALPEGAYSATVTVASNLPGVAPVQIAVELAVRLAPVATVTITPDASTLLPNQTVQLTATLRDAAGDVLTGRIVTWTTSDAAVATVSAAGLVTAAGGGTATITATSEGRTDTADITVNSPAIAVSTNTVTASTNVGSSPTAATVNVTNGGTGTLSGLSTSISYGTGASDWLTAALNSTTAPSTLTLTYAASSLAEGSYSALVTVSSSLAGVAAQQITVQLNVQRVPVASVEVTPATSTRIVGQTVQLTATLRDANDNVLTGRAVAWSSSSVSVATVNASGLVTAVGDGEATITATSEGKAGTASVTVVAPAIALSTNTVSVGTPIGSNPTPETVNITNGGTGTLSGLSTSVQYGSGQGWLTAQLSGTTAPATLTLSFAASNLAQGTYTATVTVASSLPGVASRQISVQLVVSLAPVATVTLLPSAAIVLIGDNVQTNVTLHDAAGNVLTGRAIQYTTSNANVASVSASGLVSAVGEGTATITATSEGKSDTMDMTVVQPRIVLTPKAVTLQTNVGQDPPPQSVDITNGGSGTLSGLSTSVSYAAGGPEGWLGVNLDPGKNGGVMVISAFVANNRLAAGTYTATVRVSSSLPGVQPVDLPVRLEVLASYAVRLSGIGKGSGSVTGNGFNCTITGGAATGTCLVNYAAGARITLTAAAAPGSTFVTWLGACEAFGKSPQCTLTVTADLAVGTHFEIVPPVPPVLTNLDYSVGQVNTCDFQPPNPPGTTFRFAMDYADANANIDLATAILTIKWTFSTGTTRTENLSRAFWSISGTPAQGSIDAIYCWHFSGAPYVDATWTLTDAGGLVSEPVTVRVTRPANANGADLEVNGGAGGGAGIGGIGTGPAAVRRNQD